MTTKIDATLLKALRAPITTALKDVGEKYGVVLTLGNATYDLKTGTFKLNVGSLTDDGFVMTKEASDYKSLAIAYQLNPNWLFATFQANGETYRVVGLKTRATKTPVLVTKTSDGRTYRVSADFLRNRAEENNLPPYKLTVATINGILSGSLLTEG